MSLYTAILRDGRVSVKIFVQNNISKKYIKIQGSMHLLQI